MSSVVSNYMMNIATCVSDLVTPEHIYVALKLVNALASLCATGGGVSYCL